jgi:hypothetical protein
VTARTRRCTKGAVYLHLGEQYLVEALSLEDRVAVVTPARVDWYTQAKKESETAIEESLRSDRRLGVELHFGRVSVTEQVVRYARKAVRDGGTIDVVPMLMPETTFETEAIWFCPEPDQLEGSSRCRSSSGALHAAEHSLIALLPSGAMCDAGTSAALDERPLPDGPTDDLRLRRPHGRRRHHRTRLRPLRDWVEDTTRCCSAARAQRLSVVRAEPEVRQPQRAARQGRRPAASGAHARSA